MKSKIIVAGPCAVESRAQLFATANEICNMRYAVSNFDLRFFRAGVWKARTNPNDFQGVGNEAMEWLKEIKAAFGFKICVEVASAEHVSCCLENNIDAIWIGARSTVNPFVVQEIADAVQHSSLTVLVKNPVNPDINLWIGAMKRFQNAGIKNVMAVHRGFSIEHEHVYRNAPCWELPMTLQMKMPDIPILCDISHIAGNVPLQQTIAQTAMNYNFDGLMAEVHHAPEEALSDGKQQLTPAQFLCLLKNITLQNTDNEAENALLIPRTTLKNIDIQIGKLLAKRMETVDQIAVVKANFSLPPLQPNQWKKVVEVYEENALQDENYQQFLEEFLLLLHKSSLKRQSR